MCRSIKRLRQPSGAASRKEIDEAALQFVRKVSGFRAPTARNQEAFDRAVAEISAASERLLDALPPLAVSARQA